MTPGPVLLGSTLAAILSVAAGCGGGSASTYRDRVGDVKGADGPDIASVTVSDTATSVRFRVRFAAAPPLAASTSEEWVDMLLIGIDVPPLGPAPAPSGWRGADYFVGLHGAQTAVRLAKLGSPGLDVLPAAVDGDTLSFSIPRSALGSPEWFEFSVAAGRETEREGEGSEDYAPGDGTFRYRL